jgi:hypothetical protein
MSSLILTRIFVNNHFKRENDDHCENLQQQIISRHVHIRQMRPTCVYCFPGDEMRRVLFDSESADYPIVVNVAITELLAILCR